jgi:hypothetical protein
MFQYRAMGKILIQIDNQMFSMNRRKHAEC